MFTIIAATPVNPDLSKSTYKVLICLFTELNGYNDNGRNINPDPENFKYVQIDSLASTLCLPKKKVKNALETLLELNIIEEGSSDTVHDGYRFTF
jgi:hypothetical protein